MTVAGVEARMSRGEASAGRHVLFTESSDNVGGQELQAMQQMRALTALGYDCALACRPGGRVESVALDFGLRVLPVPFRNSLHWPSLRLLRTHLSRHRPFLAVCHSGHDANNLALASRLLSRRPFLVRSKTYLAGVPKAFSYNHLVDITVVPSAYLRNELLKHPGLRPEKIEVLPPGIDFARLDAADDASLPQSFRARMAGGQARPVVMHVAMLRGEKGHRLMLEAIARLRSAWPSILYVIVGEGKERERIEQGVDAHGLREHVLLTGKVVPAHAMFRHADLVVMPSTYEPLGMSQIEALGVGVPVVVSDSGGIPETVIDNETGIVVPAGNVDAWVDALGRAIADPAMMRRMAERGRRDVRARFSVERNTSGLVNLAAAARQG